MNELQSGRTVGQFMKYILIGVGSNVILYLVYLAATGLGTEPKATMACIYVLGVIQTYFANKNWTFKYFGSNRWTLVRYGLTYLLGFLVNYIALLVLVDRYGYRHQLVQGGMIPCIAVIIFLLQKFWVFPDRDRDPE